MDLRVFKCRGRRHTLPQGGLRVRVPVHRPHRGAFRRALQLGLVLLLCGSTQGCYIYNWFKGDSAGDSGGGGGGVTGAVVGQSLGERAGAADSAALEAVYAVTSTHAPAVIRPDPDLYVRRLLGQYRPAGVTIARQVGEIEPYRLLLGGASEDFSKSPQEEYDATSLLAVFKVAEEICVGLVAPVSWAHEGWSTILPYPAANEDANIRWLAQRMIGVSSANVSDSAISELMDILSAEEPYLTEQWWGRGEYAKYVPVCAALALDAEALYL